MNKKPLTKKQIFILLKRIKYSKIFNEKINLNKANERFLDQDIKSKINLPPFKNSAVDGYALNKSDIIEKNFNLILKGEIKAGEKKTLILKKNEAVRIFTGANMPINSTTVVMQENVLIDKNKIFIKKMPHIGENCRHPGEDILKGDKILSKGDKINVKNLNLIAAIGKKFVTVKKKIKIGYYTSGNELRLPTENLKESQINNSNFYSMGVLVDKPYIASKYLGNLRDDESLIKKSLLVNSNKFNIIITTGGASVGKEDHLVKVIKKIGKIFFWKSAIKPGRPLAIGKIKNSIIICLPGNPVSVHLLFGMLVKPFIEFLCSGKLIEPSAVLAKTNFSMNKKTNRLEWLRVKIKRINNELYADLYPKQGSGMISSIAFSDGILEIPENISLIKKNENYLFYSFKSLF